jgi:Fe-S oxidoreductase
MEMVIALRSTFVEKGRVHPNVKTALESTFRYGNPLTMPREDRAAWVGELPVKSYEEGTRYLFFVGCTPSFDPRVQQVARSLARLLERAGVDYGILGEGESCCGSEIRRLGEAGLFEMMVEENQELFKSMNIHNMFTTSPHCFNVFKNDYPKNGLQVQHYTQLLAGLLEGRDVHLSPALPSNLANHDLADRQVRQAAQLDRQETDLRPGRLYFSGGVEATVTYHDPCYLGKHNQIFDEPRKVLQSIPGVRLVEMDRSREKSLCCEGGGGRMWLEGTNPSTRLAQMRVKEALDTGAEILATACPFCLLTLDEAVKHLNASERIRVMDVAEIAAQAL